jgi:hypothetical protein
VGSKLIHEKTRSKKSRDTVPLKGPKPKILEHWFFTQFRHVRVGDLRSWPNNLKNVVSLNHQNLDFLAYFLSHLPIHRLGLHKNPDACNGPAHGLSVGISSPPCSPLT